MPLYELLVVMRSMKETQTIATMKRMGQLLLDNGALLRSIQNIGLNRELAHKTSSHGKVHHTGSFILYKYDAPISLLQTLLKEVRLDVDIIKVGCVQVKKPKDIKCTLEGELQIPAKRPSVQELMKTGARPSKPGYGGIVGGPF
ncbi:probable 28S ribosomal protein S6, mitochondrial [Varroa jacobsoni]|uniref:Small ribosomal subunit protein bS6m n=1 Tax=Varroa destructor TaxID=109461 RepID=A0A7M7JEL4_VARDE|nr:probable 28S ribosomal protein S6, mitochondrial [Varroa destructor]XP_022702852.1 probable 28S ribosomal protein S6, mitochondrial [Varroa jacobsoni]